MEVLPSQRIGGLFSGIDAPDVGPIDPNLDVDLYLETTLPALTKVWLGEESVSEAIAAGNFISAGEPELIGTFEGWIGTSNFAGVQSKTVMRKYKLHLNTVYIPFGGIGCLRHRTASPTI